MTNKIIGISGKKRHGKDTVGQIIQNLRPNAVRIAYADALKREVAIMVSKYQNALDHTTGIDVAKVDKLIKQMNDDTIDPKTGVAMKEKFRLILQWWGTEFRRQMFTDSYWRDRLAEQLEQLSPDKLAIITDVRFPDEADQVKEMGGILIRVNRPGINDQSNHPSETALDSYGKVALDTVLGAMFDPLGERLPMVEQNDWDVILENDGSLGDLEMKVQEMLTAYGY